jgi:L-threonylcarbamoyladenylate synthase
MEIAAKSQVRPADALAVREAARLLRAGKLVAFPTETVYGLGADATNDHAVADIFAAKERPRFNPLIVHVENRERAEEYAHFNAAARKLAAAFWPGALTLVLPRRAGCALSQLVSAGLDTVALRVPAHSIARELLAKSGRPIAAPSANASGRISATTAEHVRKSLGGKVDIILDAGPTALGLESTVIGFDAGVPVLLRPGAISRGDIENIVGRLKDSAGVSVRAPGQLASHYAPRASVRLNADSVRQDEALLAFGPEIPHGAKVTANLSDKGDVREAAVNLFAHLHALDATGLPIAVMPIPRDGLGEAINDRLERAAAARDKS